jgi:hypothetical protein
MQLQAATPVQLVMLCRREVAAPHSMLQLRRICCSSCLQITILEPTVLLTLITPDLVRTYECRDCLDAQRHTALSWAPHI